MLGFLLVPVFQNLLAVHIGIYVGDLQVLELQLSEKWLASCPSCWGTVVYTLYSRSRELLRVGKRELCCSFILLYITKSGRKILAM